MKLFTFICLVFSISFALSDQKQDMDLLDWREVSINGLKLGETEYRAFTSMGSFKEISVERYEPDFGEYDFLTKATDSLGSIYYFSGKQARLVSFESAECNLSLSAIKIKSKESFQAVSRKLKRFQETHVLSPSDREQGRIDIRLASSSDEYLVLWFSKADKKLVKCETWLDN